jgi:hypothetical protein
LYFVIQFCFFSTFDFDEELSFFLNGHGIPVLMHVKVLNVVRHPGRKQEPLVVFHPISADCLSNDSSKPMDLLRLIEGFRTNLGPTERSFSEILRVLPSAFAGENAGDQDWIPSLTNDSSELWGMGQ